MNKYAGLGIGVLSAMLLLACKGQDVAVPAHTGQSSAAEDAAGQTAAAPQMVDVIETSASQIIGISYPHDASVPSGLVKVLQDYAGQARAELQAALDELGNDKPRVPYELSLSFTVSADTPALMAVSADGSRYTGGAHGQPLVARFVWLKQEGRLLPIDQLIVQPASRSAIAAYVQEQLLAQMESRLRADNLSEPEQADMRRNARQMINQGTEPDAQNFSQFLPVIDRQGRIEGLRFVFPPYQVGPYSDGTQSVEVPLDVLLPHLEPKYLPLFSAHE